VKYSRQNLFFLIVICGVAGASIPSFAKIALESMNSGVLTLIRYGVTFITLFLIFGLTRKLNWRNVWRAIPVSVFMAVNIILFAIAIRYISAASSPLLYNMVPLMVALLSWWLLKTHLGRNKLIGLLVGFTGVGLVTLAPHLEHSGNLQIAPLGVFLVFVSSIAFSLYTVLSKPLQDEMKWSEMLIATAIAVIVGQAGYMLAIAEPFAFAQITTKSWLAALEIATVGTLLFYGLYQLLIKVSGPVSASLMVYVQPVAGAFWSYFLLDEHLGHLAILGGLIALVGIAQVNGVWADLRKRIHA
jgi:drug/metabolite transporter (DMT)-like permease